MEFELIEEATLALAKRGQMQAVPGCLRLIDGLITDYNASIPGSSTWLSIILLSSMER